MYQLISLHGTGKEMLVTNVITGEHAPAFFETLEEAEEAVTAVLEDPNRPSTMTGVSIMEFFSIVTCDLDGKRENIRVDGSNPPRYCESCRKKFIKMTERALRKIGAKECPHGEVCRHLKCRACLEISKGGV